MRRLWGRPAPVLGGLLLAAIVIAGCAPTPTAGQQASLAACTRFSIGALRHDAAVSSLPPACKGLGRARLTAAADAAVRAVDGTMSGKRLMRARRRELSALLPHLSSLGRVPRSQPLSTPGAGQGSGRGIGFAALAAWLITVGLGLIMMAKWITRAGIRRAWTGSGARPMMNFAHLGLAVAGLAIWTGYLATGLAGLAWTACALLLPVTGLGISVLVQRVPRRLPVIVLAGHITFTVATLLLTLLAAIGAG